MAFIDLETSREDGRPVIFYAFQLNNVTWRYTSADEDLTVAGFTWKSAPIVDDGIKQTGETVNDALTLEGPSWLGPATLFMSAAPSKAVQFTMFAKHEGDSEIRAAYVGEITQVNFPIPGRCRITVETLASTMEREGLRLAWQRSCPYSLYDEVTCKVDKANWGVPFRVLKVEGFSAEIELTAGREDGFFNSGFIEWAHPIRGSEFLPVDVHSGSQGSLAALIVFLGSPGDLFAGSTGMIYPGCNFTPENCQTFGNYDNYGGVPDLPGKSPFDGNPVF